MELIRTKIIRPNLYKTPEEAAYAEIIGLSDPFDAEAEWRSPDYKHASKGDRLKVEEMIGSRNKDI